MNNNINIQNFRTCFGRLKMTARMVHLSAVKMNCLHLLLILLIIGQPVLFAQKDTVKKSFKPYGLIDAAPVAIGHEEFKPPINITIHMLDAITNLPVNAKVNYYTFEDTVVKTKLGKDITLTINRNEKACIISNAAGYYWQTEIFNTPESDTSFVLKFLKIKKRDIIRIPVIDLDESDTKFESYQHPDLLALNYFLTVNPTVKIQILTCSKWKDELQSHLIKNNDEQRIRIKNCRNKKCRSLETFTIKILHI